MIFKKKLNFIDLSLQITSGMQKYHANYHPVTKIVKTANHKNYKREVRKIITGTHSGTHIDAPVHFINYGKSIDKYKLNHFLGPARLLNFSRVKNRTEISLESVKKITKNKLSEKIIIFRFDWTDKFYGKKNFYIDHPFLSPELCRWLVKKKVKLIGIDIPQPDNPFNTRNSSNDGINHKILLSNDVLILEYMTNLQNIKKNSFFFVGAPLNIKESDGSPCRALAIY